MADLDHDLPINVIMLQNFDMQKNELIDGYMDVLKTCRRKAEFRALIEMIVQEVYEYTLRDILTKDIQNKAKLLDDLKK